MKLPTLIHGKRVTNATLYRMILYLQAELDKVNKELTRHNQELSRLDERKANVE